MRVARYSILPVIAAFAAFFAVLPPTGADAQIRIIDQGGSWVLAPATGTVPVNGRVAFRNETAVTHTASCAKVGCWDSGDIQPGETVFVTVADEGDYRFVCRYHQDVPGLAGQVTAGEPAPAASPSPSPSPSV